jgi:hypothetical protein
MSIRLDTQRMDFWCWAAVAQAIDRFFNPSTTRTQCDIAGLLIRNQPCCTRPALCDEAQSLREALTEINHLAEFREGRIPMGMIRDQRNRGLPFAARIEWPDGGGHFVIISGFRRDARGEGVLDVSDPWDDPVESVLMPYRQFANAYRSIGVWTHTYLLRP